MSEANMLENFLKELHTEMEIDNPFPKEGPGHWSIVLDDDLKISIT